MEHITKMFPGVKALNDVNFDVEKGEIHCLVGENGAGKSTLMNVLCGIYPYGTYSGSIYFQGEETQFKTIKDSEHTGIVIIFQELALVPTLSIRENIFLGNERVENGVINWYMTDRDASEVMKRVGLHENPQTLIKDIGVGKQQLVEIAKALSRDVQLLILDEPTAALNENESNNLLNLMLELKKDGVTCVLISHKLNEVARVADSITILRDGATIETIKRGNQPINEARIIRGMVGRDMVDRFPKRDAKIGEIGFEIKDWTVHDPLQPDRIKINHVNLNVRHGEIIGIAGLMGAGRTELAMSVFGKMYGVNISGQIIKDGRCLTIHTVRDAIGAGIAYATEDRKTYGLILIKDIIDNISLASLNKVSANMVINRNREIQAAEEYREKLNIKCSGVTQRTNDLSGGNQQKVVLSKWIFAEPDCLILDEPTRGIDVGAKYEIYTIMNNLAEMGKTVIMISSELPEILGVCDRIYVMDEGEIVGELTRDNASQEAIMKCIMDNHREEAI
jgi:putative multiple sugar transport system ATP-binding protein